MFGKRKKAFNKALDELEKALKNQEEAAKDLREFADDLAEKTERVKRIGEKYDLKIETIESKYKDSDAEITAENMIEILTLLRDKLAAIQPIWESE